MQSERSQRTFKVRGTEPLDSSTDDVITTVCKCEPCKQAYDFLVQIIGGPSQALERISALGLPLGTTTSDIVIRNCGWITRAGQYREGNPNTIKFPPRRKIKK